MTLRRLAGDGRAVPLSLAGLSFVVAFAQAPLRVVTDTRMELSVDPGLFLSRVGSVWSPTADLGHVQTSQFVGYLFPMGPWFAFTHWLGLATLVAQRVWLGALLALAAWGAVKLMDEVYGGPRGLAHLVAGFLFAFSPFVAVFVSRGTGNLLAATGLPWLMVAVIRGVREPGRWRWPAFAALVGAAGGAGLNAAEPGWLLPGLGALLVYEAVVIGRPARDVWAFTWRAALCGFAASAWWIVPILISSQYANDFLRFTEQPDAIFATTSVPESLRLLGYWVSYFGQGYGGTLKPAVWSSPTYLFSKPVIVGTFAVPTLALVTGLRWLRGWAYAPFFGLLAVGGVVIMAIGFPETTPLSHALVSAYYNHVPGIEGMRTTYKAAPLVGLSLACLGGGVAAAAVGRFRRLGHELLDTRLIGWAAGAVVCALVLLWGWPLFTGHATDRRATYGHVPRPWRAAVADSDRTTPANRRLMALPGALFADYQWGSTVASVAPALAHHPVMIREIPRYSDPRADQLQATTDDLVGQGRLVPGQLDQLLRLLGVGQVIVANDANPELSSALDPSRLRASLAAQRTFARPLADYGSRHFAAPPTGRDGPVVFLPELSRYGVAAAPGLVRVQSQAAPDIVDGDAVGVTELAAHGALGSRALIYAGDLSRGTVRSLLPTGAHLVFTDTNRRQMFLPSQLTANLGPTLGAHDPIPHGGATYELFPGEGADERTVATYSGLSALFTATSRTFALFPQHRPYAALDGRLDTAWIGSSDDPASRYLDLVLAHPHPVAAISVYPEADSAGVTSEIAISVNGSPERRVELSRGWNEVAIGVPLRELRLRGTRISRPGLFAIGGIAELRIPGVSVHEALRMPTDLTASASGSDLSHNPVTVLLQRTTADFPYRNSGIDEAPSAHSLFNLVDGESGLRRIVDLPAPRRFAVDGWASVSPTTPDWRLDRLEGRDPRWRFTSSSRFEGVPAHRASSAFDGNPRTEWVGQVSTRRPPWIAWRAPKPITVRHIRLAAGGELYARVREIRVVVPHHRPVRVGVRQDGLAQLPHPIHTRSMQIRIASYRAAANGLRELAAVALSEVEIPGLRQPPPPRPRRFVTRCGELRVSAAGRTADARVVGPVTDLEQGRPVRFRGCGPHAALDLPAGSTELSAPAGLVMRPDHLRLSSAAPRPLAPPPAPGSLQGGKGFGTSEPRDVHLALTRPAWLVLAESYSSGWRAWCRNSSGRERSLGKPVPIDGFANGWRVGPGCRVVRFMFAAQPGVNVAYVFSGIGGLLLFGFVVLAAMRGRGRRAYARDTFELWTLPPAEGHRRLGLPLALAVAAAAAGGAWVLGSTAGVGVGAVALALGVVGVSQKRLLLLAAAGLTAVPILYLIHPVPDQGGFNFLYARKLLDAHWVALVALACIGAAAVLEARVARRSRLAAPPVALDADPIRVTPMPMEVQAEKAHWEEIAAQDPFWAVLAFPWRKRGRWDADEFYATGEREIAEIMQRCESLGRPARHERALDFGCGLGRLTRALSLRYESALGVDISENMVARARELNADFDRAEFYVNPCPDLRELEGDSFDLVYTGRVLQHLPSREDICRYLGEFLRVVRDDGIVVFQLPTALDPLVRAEPRRKLYLVLRRLGLSARFLYWRLGLHPNRMKFMTVDDTTRFVESHGGRVLRVETRRDPDLRYFEEAIYYVQP